MIGTYYVVYEPSGVQCGHVRIEDIERERRRYPKLRYEEAHSTNRYLRQQAEVES